MFISADTISLVQNCNLPSNISQLAVSKKPHKFGQKLVFHNTESVNEPRITIYPEYRRSHWIRVEFELSKMIYGNNIQLLDADEIVNALNLVSKNVEQRTTIAFDALNVQITRIDYAANLYLPSLSPNKFLQNYFNYKVKNLTRHIVESSTVYFENTQRVLCMYDKYIQLAKDIGISKEVLRKAERLVRIEYRFLNKTALNKLADRLELEQNLAKYLLAPKTIKTVLDEMSNILNLDKFKTYSDSPIGSQIREMFQRLGNIKQVIKIFGFIEVYKEYGEDFYLLEELDISKSTYTRMIKEIQESGVSIIMSSKVSNLNQKSQAENNKICGSLETASGKKCGSIPKMGQRRCFRHKENNRKQKKGVGSTLLQHIPIPSNEHNNHEQELREKFLISYEKHFGNITRTCLEIGIDRKTYYNWKNSTKAIDTEFVKRLDLIKPKEKLLDIAENRVVAEIQNMDSPRGSKLAFQVLKTKGKDRGYS